MATTHKKKRRGTKIKGAPKRKEQSKSVKIGKIVTFSPSQHLEKAHNPQRETLQIKSEFFSDSRELAHSKGKITRTPKVPFR